MSTVQTIKITLVMLLEKCRIYYKKVISQRIYSYFHRQAVVIELLKEEILRRGKDVNGYIIDGFPRTSKQASQFVKEIKDVDAVIYLYSKVNEMISRVRQKKECVKQDEDIKNEIFDYIRDVKNGTIKFSTKIHKVMNDIKLCQY